MDEIARLQAKQEAAALAAIERAGWLIIGEAQRIVPHDEGELGATGNVEIEKTARGADAVLSFSKVYAEIQHEDLSLTHKAGRRAKYLEEPFNRAAPRLPGIVAAAVKGATG